MVDAGSLPGGHEAREIGGVCEEGEDGFDGVGKLLLGVEVQTHDYRVGPASLRSYCPTGTAGVGFWPVNKNWGDL